MSAPLNFFKYFSTTNIKLLFLFFQKIKLIVFITTKNYFDFEMSRLMTSNHDKAFTLRQMASLWPWLPVLLFIETSIRKETEAGNHMAECFVFRRANLWVLKTPTYNFIAHSYKFRQKNIHTLGTSIYLLDYLNLKIIFSCHFQVWRLRIGWAHLAWWVRSIVIL
jgi:hypothetical protein